MPGWIKLHRKIQNSAMYRALNSVQRDVMINCLLLANHEPNKWYWGNTEFTCEPGQFITSLDSIKSYCAKGTSIKNVRTSLVKLEKMGFLANRSAKTGRLITVLNWSTYQSDQCDTGKDTGKEVANDRQRGGKEVATNKNDKNDKNARKKKDPKSSSGKTLATGTDTWIAYSNAYKFRYKSQPVRNARTNSLCKQLVTRLGAVEAPQVASYYLSSQNGFYVSRGHSLECLIKDAEKIRTEWFTGQQITQAGAREADRLQNQGNIWGKVISENIEKEGNQ